MKFVLAAIALFGTIALAFTPRLVKKIIPDAGWYQFEYTHATEAFFQVDLQQIGYLYVIGCGCPRDGISVYDNGIPMYYQCPGSGVPVGGSCPSPILDLTQCSQNASYCQMLFQISPGFHNITVQVDEAFFRYNLLGVRVDNYCVEQGYRCCEATQDSIQELGCVEAVVGIIKG